MIDFLAIQQSFKLHRELFLLFHILPHIFLKALLDAFEAGDAARAMQCCGEHLEKLIAQEDVLRRQYPDYFSEKMEKGRLDL